MAKINLFKAYLPQKDKAEFFAVSPENKSIKDTINHKKFSFLHTLHPNDNFSLTKDEEITFYKEIKSKFKNFVNQHNFILNQNKALYIYRQTNLNSTYTGIIGAADIPKFLVEWTQRQL